MSETLWMNEMGGACNTHWGDVKCVPILVRNPEGKRHKEDLGVDGGFIIKLTSRE
jgi:hypothetical protein